MNGTIKKYPAAVKFLFTFLMFLWFYQLLSGKSSGNIHLKGRGPPQSRELFPDPLLFRI